MDQETFANLGVKQLVFLSTDYFSGRGLYFLFQSDCGPGGPSLSMASVQRPMKINAHDHNIGVNHSVYFEKSSISAKHHRWKLNLIIQRILAR